MLSITLQIFIFVTFIALMVFVWRVSKRPGWRMRAVIYGWGASILWAIFWVWVMPTWFRGVMDSDTLVKTFPDGTFAMFFLVFGWIWPAVVVAIGKSRQASILLLLLLMGCSTDSLTPEFKPWGVPVRAIHGEVEYTSGGIWEPLRVNRVLTSGTQIRTGHNSEVLFLVGRSVGLKLTADSEFDLSTLTAWHDRNWIATRTALELRRGTILCLVKKLSPESLFQIRGGGVTVDVRKGGFQMSADGSVVAVTGEIKVQAGEKTFQLRTGEFFDSKKNEIGRTPNRPNMWGDFFVDGGFPDDVLDHVLFDFGEVRQASPPPPRLRQTTDPAVTHGPF